MAPILSIFLHLGIVAVTVLNAQRASRQWDNYRALVTMHSSYQAPGTGYEGDSFPRELPLQVDAAVMRFDATKHYSLNATAEWDSVIPTGHGWVRLGKEHRPFAVSMYHQLHCIDGIRRALLSTTMQPSHTAHSKSHANHCFNYLRQLLLCKADITLEPTVITPVPGGQLAASASGEGVLHICRNWGQVRSYAEDNASQWSAWGSAEVGL